MCIRDSSEQLPQEKKAIALENINRALERVKNAKVDDGLTEAERAIAEANLKKLAASYQEVTAPKNSQPVALIPGM
jgi:hypothetical protein